MLAAHLEQALGREGTHAAVTQIDERGVRLASQTAVGEEGSEERDHHTEDAEVTEVESPHLL